jgi:hypothetical protein
MLCLLEQSRKQMGKPKDKVELRLFVTIEQRNEIKSCAAAKGLKVTEYFLELHNSRKTNNDV